MLSDTRTRVSSINGDEIPLLRACRFGVSAGARYPFHCYGPKDGWPGQHVGGLGWAHHDSLGCPQDISESVKHLHLY